MCESKRTYKIMNKLFQESFILTASDGVSQIRGHHLTLLPLINVKDGLFQACNGSTSDRFTEDIETQVGG